MTEIEGYKAALRSGMATFEDRLVEVEKGLNIPPMACAQFLPSVAGMVRR